MYSVDIDNNLAKAVVKADMKKYEDDAAKEIAAKVKRPGFRPGALPLDMVKADYKDMIIRNITERVVSESYPKIVQEKKLDVLGQYSITDLKMEGDHIEVEISIPLFPTFKLPKYKGLGLKLEEAKVDKKAITEILKSVANKNRVTAPKKGKAKSGDIAIIDFEGFVDGKSMAKAEAHELELGSKSFIDTFEEQIVGHEVGESFTVDVTFPKEYREESLSGKPAKFNVTLQELKSSTAPKIDDELAKTEGFKDLKEFEAYIRSKLMEKKSYEASENFFNSLVEQVAAKAKFDAPEFLVQQEVEARKAKAGKELNSNELKKMSESVAAEVREMLVIRAILKAENIVADKDSVAELLKAKFNMNYDDVVSSANHARFLTELESNVKVDKLKQFLIENN